LSGDNLTKKTHKDPFTSLHKIKANLPHWAEFEILRNGALSNTEADSFMRKIEAKKRAGKHHHFILYMNKNFIAFKNFPKRKQR